MIQNKEEFFKIVKEEKIAQPEKSGISPMGSLAHELKFSDATQKNNFEDILKNSIEYFDSQFDEEDFINISNLILLADLPGTRFINEFKTWFDRKEKDKKSIHKRAILLRLLSNLHYAFTEKNLDNQKDIKTLYFWYWIKAVRNLKMYDKVKSLIADRIASHPNEIRSLFVMLNSMSIEIKDNKKFQSFGNLWVEKIKDKNDRKRFCEWFKERGMDLNPDISDEDKTFLKKVNKNQVSEVYCN